MPRPPVRAPVTHHSHHLSDLGAGRTRHTNGRGADHRSCSAGEAGVDHCHSVCDGGCEDLGDPAITTHDVLPGEAQHHPTLGHQLVVAAAVAVKRLPAAVEFEALSLDDDTQPLVGEVDQPKKRADRSIRTCGVTLNPGISRQIARRTDSMGPEARGSAWAATRSTRCLPRVGQVAARSMSWARVILRSRSAESAIVSASSKGRVAAQSRTVRNGVVIHPWMSEVGSDR